MATAISRAAVQEYELRIPQSTAGEAVKVLARQTGYSVIFQSDEVKSVRTNAVAGRYTIEEALDALFTRTNLSYGLSDGDVIAITRSPSARSENQEGKLSRAKSKSQLSRLFSGVSAAVLAGLGSAEAQGAGAAQQGADEERSTRSDQIVVTAQKREETIQDVPISITAFGEFELERRGVDDFYDYARLVPGLAFTDQGAGNASFFIRGVASPAGNPTTQFYIDDMPQLSSNAASTVIKSADPAIFDVSRIEVLRGPQGTLFGASAMGGMIRVITNRPDASEFQAAVGSDVFTTQGGEESLAINGMVNAPLIENVLAVRAVAVVREEGGWIDRVPNTPGGLLPGTLSRDFAPLESNIDNERQHAARLSALFTPNDDLSMRATVFWQDIEESNRHTIDDVRGGRMERGGTVDEPREDRFTQYNFTLEYDVGPVEFISSTSYLDRYIWERTDFTFLGARVFGTGPNFPYFNERVNDLSIFATEARMQSSGTGPFSFTFGGFYLDMDGGEDQLVNAPGFTARTGINARNDTLFDENTLSTESRKAVFGQASYRFFDRLEVIGGFRYFDVDIAFDSLKDGAFNGGFTDTERDIAETGWTPKAAVKFDIDEQKQIYASASKGFRVGSPNFFVPQDACGADLAALGFAEAPELIESDNLWQYEAGAKAATPDGRFSVNAAVYYTDWKGIPQTIPLNCGFSVSLNVGEASSKGFELELWGEPVEGLDLQAAVGYSDAKLELDAPDVGGEAGDRLQQVPRWTVAFSGQYTFPILDTYEGYVRGDYSYISDSYISFNFADPTDRRPSYQIADFKIGVVGDTWEGTLYIENAFNELAVLGINPTDVNEWTVNRPRTFGLRFKKRWN